MQIRHRETFTTIHTEGSILPADLLQRIADGKGIEGLDPSDYHLSGRLNEAINRSWNHLLATWTAFKNSISQLPEKDLGTGVTRERWLLPLFQELGYGRLLVTKAVEIDGKSYPISHSWHLAPIHLVGFRLSIDKKVPGAVGAAKMSPHGLMQEYLNRSDGHLWGFVSNGLRLRILRDTVSLTKQSYIEFDVEGMMDGEVYSDFVIFWLLCHESRLEADKPEDCWLEKWSKGAQEEGTRALDQLRSGVEKAIESLGRGFLSNAANTELRDRLRTGTLDKQEYYRQILRLVYRLILLFVAEDRGVLLNPEAAPAAIERYSRFYSLARIRRLAEKKAGTRHSDLYQAVKLVMEKLGSDHECAELGLSPLGSFLFSSDSIKEISGCSISNRDLLDAIRSLTFITYDHSRRPVDYKHIGSEELGSVYESLLEQHPEINIEAGGFSLQTASGHERKTTGSYYTPSSLVQCLLDSALDPVLEKAASEKNPEEAILNLKVCDPACGSGHFLVAAAHRIAKRLATTRTGDDEPSPASVRKALRDVVGRCIYGVDLNPMAAELCKVSLWMEAMEPGKPLSFLDHHIKWGNSLLGTTPKLIAEGIPDDAFTPIEGDDKAFTATLKKRNKQERPPKKGYGQSTMYSLFARSSGLAELAKSLTELNIMSDDSITALRQKENKYYDITGSSEYQRNKLIADAWCAAFVLKKHKDALAPITHDIFRRISTKPDTPLKQMVEEICRLSEQYSFFHWNIGFSDVFHTPIDHEKPTNVEAGWTGGFDVVLGNPPWEKLQLEETKFFSRIAPDIAKASARQRKEAIRSLSFERPDVYECYSSTLRNIAGQAHFAKNSGRFPLSSGGNVSTHSLFIELSTTVVCQNGRVGLVAPSGLATQDTQKHLFSTLTSLGRLISLFDFENRSGLFPGIHFQFRFCIVTIGPPRENSPKFEFAFLLQSPVEIRQPGRSFRLSYADLCRFSPNTMSCPQLLDGKEAILIGQIYRNGKVVYNENTQDNPWGWRSWQVFNETHEASLLTDNSNSDDILPLYEGKLFHQFDHRYASYIDQVSAEHLSHTEKQIPELTSKTRYFVPKRLWYERIASGGYTAKWIVVFRRITNSTNERTSIFCILPMCITGSQSPAVKTNQDAALTALLVGNLNSFVFDFAARRRVGGTDLNHFVIHQLPVLTPMIYSQSIFFKTLRQTSGDGLLPHVLELTYTAWDLEPFAKDCGYNGPPFRWDDDRRFMLRCELDAAYFHLYGIERDDVDYIMETFPIVKRKDEQQYGEYRTKRVILEIYDAMAEASRSGRSYHTRLDPPPADPSMAHPPKELPRTL